MKIIKFKIIFILFCLLASSVRGRTVDSDIYPTEEELFEAYLTGQIDYQTYLNLREIFESGVDSSEWYLLDEIPNIALFTGAERVQYTRLEREQTEPYITKGDNTGDGRLNGKARWNRYQKLNYIGNDKNRFFLDSRLSSNWSVKINGAEDYDGRRECSFRTFNYIKDTEAIRRLVIGNYTAKFGLGLSIGYRGKLLDKNDLSLEETIFYPEYGGFNGLYIEGGPSKNPIRWLFHYDQNETNRIRMTALSIEKKFARYKFEGTVLGSILSDRKTGNEYRHYQLGILCGYSNPEYDAALEIVLPKKVSIKNRAALFESFYRGVNFNLKLSVWSYGRDFLNFFGGGRSGDIYRTVALDEIDFDFRDRRNDQQGVLIKTRTPLTDISNIDMSFSLYGSSGNDRITEFGTSLGQSISDDSEFRLYYELIRKERVTGVTEDNIFRTEYGLTKPGIFLRSYLGYRFDENRKRYLSHFFRARFKNNIFEELEIWLNFSRINLEKVGIEYFYGYISEKIKIIGTVALSVKYIYRYNRNYADPGETTLYLETTAVW